MKALHFFIALTFVVSIAVVSGCSDKDKEEAAARELARLDSIRVSDSLANVRLLDSLASIADSLLEEKNKLEEVAPVTTRTSSGAAKSGGKTSVPKVEEKPVEEPTKTGEFTPGKKGAEAETEFTPGKKGEVPATGDAEKAAEPFVPGKKK